MKEVSFTYRGNEKKVLNHISADFEDGKVCAIVGESGSGKTTLLSLIAGLTSSSSGVIAYQGKDIKHMNKDRYRSNKIGVIFQSYNLLLADTAAENVMLSIQLGGNKVKGKSQLAYVLLAKVGIDKEKADRKVLKLSGGEQQRVAIARSLSYNPILIIADEPTGKLDEKNEKGIMDIVRNLAHIEGKCVILVTHSASVTEYADVVMEIRNGSLSRR
ncbi:ABC transporter ATP-binding protein [Paenibacillus mendelii]|uniref:ABC transporter ATP-binding protein n=1 Tax=Paenibacillus mendelii TaxID=206163 RepID=A0ABV6JED6_9BACL|nr:ABC transporter ATP-binding protein [Paenibacillus mendelii]MCQ6557134.1 ABC transporter ATP-binding protein [Paenibacillus mendelii]